MATDPVAVGEGFSAVPRTSTIALTNATLRYGLRIAGAGLEESCRASRPISTAVNTYKGKLTNKNVADALNMEYTPLDEMIK